jgi:hypothetical protein
MPLTVLFDLDDTVMVDDARAFEAARDARDKHGRKARLLAMPPRRPEFFGLRDPAMLLSVLGISAFECLWEDSKGWRIFRLKWAFTFREQVFDRALRKRMIESAEGSRDLAEAFAR